jgi:hypothetical protein
MVTWQKFTTVGLSLLGSSADENGSSNYPSLKEVWLPKPYRQPKSLFILSAPTLAALAMMARN